MKVINRTNSPMETNAYVDGIRIGKKNTLDKIYQHFFPKVHHFVVKNSGTKEDAKDIFQEALLVIYNNVLDKDFKLTCKFGTYLHAICRNIWFKQIRENKKIITQESDNESQSISPDELEEAIIWLERYKIYKRQFQNLGEKCQKLLKMYLEGIDMSSIAEQFGFANVAYARKRKFKCKEQLILKIEKDSEYQKLLADD